jgi:hypothetical protein
MLARHSSQIARQENRLGRHYSRFRPIRRIAHQQYQKLAQSRCAKNRRWRCRTGEVRLTPPADGAAKSPAPGVGKASAIRA